MVEDAWWLRRGVEARDWWVGRWGMPYSRSLAGVGGRFEGLSEWRLCWEGVGVIALWARLSLLGSGGGRK